MLLVIPKTCAEGALVGVTGNEFETAHESLKVSEFGVPDIVNPVSQSFPKTLLSTAKP
ncbi:MAG: hypothetical protein Kow00109_05920 [Acidobacteriota bacterium]